MNPRAQTYLGDGVYAVWEDGVLTLDLRGQPGDVCIVLEPEVYAALVVFVGRCSSARAEGAPLPPRIP